MHSLLHNCHQRQRITRARWLRESHQRNASLNLLFTCSLILFLPTDCSVVNLQPVLEKSLPALHLRLSLSSCSQSISCPSLRTRPTLLLALRGGGEEEDGDDGSECETRDKYEFVPPPDEERYTHGVAPHPSLSRDSNATANEEPKADDEEDERSVTDSEDNEPQWVEGQIRQGGTKLRYSDGHADYHRDVLNCSHPDKAFVENFDRGETYSDFHLIHRRHMSVTLSQQDQEVAEYRASINASHPTHNWTWNELPNFIEAEYHNASEYKHTQDMYEYDILKRAYKHTRTFKYADSLLLSNKTRLLGQYEARAKFIPPNSESLPDEAHSGMRILQALDDAQRWVKGELPMELNDEDLAEIQRDQV